jgi:hypothetical protein
LDGSIALVEFSKPSRRACVKTFEYANIEVGLKIWFRHRRGGFGPAGAFAGGFTPRGAPSADVDAGDGGADSPTQGLRRTAAGMKLKVPPRR